MTGQVKIVLKSGKDQSLRRRHPWVFSGAIKKIYGNPAEGEVVAVYDNKDEKLGSGHFSEGSIAIRMLTFGENNPGDDFWENKILEGLEPPAGRGSFSSRKEGCVPACKC